MCLGAQGPTSQASAILIIVPAFPQVVDMLNIPHKVSMGAIEALLLSEMQPKS